MRDLCAAMKVADYCLKTGACTSLPPDPAAWYELHVTCTRIFHETYQDLDPAFALMIAVCAEIHKAYNEGVSDARAQTMKAAG